MNKHPHNRTLNRLVLHAPKPVALHSLLPEFFLSWKPIPQLRIMQSPSAFAVSTHTIPLGRSSPPATTSFSSVRITPAATTTALPPPSTSNPAIALTHTRRTFVASCGALFGLSAAAHVERVMATPVSALQGARNKLDEADALITSAKWDAIRTLLAKDPVYRAKDACNSLVENASFETRGILVGLREDVLSAMKLLDAAVYSNVFIGEDREILGTKVDYDVPRIYLKDLKGALDDIIQLADE